MCCAKKSKMENYIWFSIIILFLNLGNLFTSSIACPSCTHPFPPHPQFPPKHPPLVKPPPFKPPYLPKPPPPKPKETPVSPPPYLKPYPPPTPTLPPPISSPPSPYIKPYPPPTLLPPPPPSIKKPSPTPSTSCPPPPPPQTCPIDALNLGACVDVLGGLIHIGIGKSPRDSCCPMLEGLLDLDAAICLCSVIKAKLLDITVIIPIALQVLVGCGKSLPPGFQCH